MTTDGHGYQECIRCVMDSSDPEIYFDSQGVCNHCHRFDVISPSKWFPDDNGKRWNQHLQEIRTRGSGKDYDSVIGLSGGIDSAYLALKAVDWDLRPLLVHIDTGWNSELAVANIETITKATGFDLYTHVVEWEQMKELQLAFLRSGLSNQDVPQDHVIFSNLYHLASKQGIKSVLSGGNFATESVFPSAWHHSAMDSINLRDVNRKFGTSRLNSYRTISPFRYLIGYPFLERMVVYRPLNYFRYLREDAIKELTCEIGFKPYGHKHGESTFTNFFQNYYLPKKFGFDKRRPHFSSMILSGQLSRHEALALLASPAGTDGSLGEDIRFVCSKLGISESALQSFIAGDKAVHSDFRSWDSRIRALAVLRSFAERFWKNPIQLKY